MSVRTWATAHRDSVAPAPVPSPDVLLAALDVIGAAATPFGDAELRRVFAEQQPSSVHATLIVTPFHSSAVPHLPLADYARHVANATGYGAEGLAVGLALMARYDRAAVARATAAAGANSADVDATLVGVTALTMHRLFATCMQLGMKTASDHFVKNAYVARLVGMTLAELNALELELAVALDFRCMPTAGEMCELPRALSLMIDADYGRTERRQHVRALMNRVCAAPLVPSSRRLLPRFDPCVADHIDVANAASMSPAATCHGSPATMRRVSEPSSLLTASNSS